MEPTIRNHSNKPDPFAIHVCTVHMISSFLEVTTITAKISCYASVPLEELVRIHVIHVLTDC